MSDAKSGIDACAVTGKFATERGEKIYNTKRYKIIEATMEGMTLYCYNFSIDSNGNRIGINGKDLGKVTELNRKIKRFVKCKGFDSLRGRSLRGREEEIK